MRRLLSVLLLLALTGCAHVQPVVKYTCMGCQALLASGVCSMMRAAPPSGLVLVPECKDGTTLVVKNWKQMAEKGDIPILACEKEK